MADVSGPKGPEKATGSENFYSPTSQIGSKDKSAGYYEATFSGCSDDARQLLEVYAGIPADQVDNHVVAIVRERIVIALY